MLEIKESVIADLQWMESNPNALILLTKSGDLLIYDLSHSIEEPVERIHSSLKETDEAVFVLQSERLGATTIVTK